MKRRRILLFVLVGLVVVASATWYVLRPREPEYEGRPLSDWLTRSAERGGPISAQARAALAQAGPQALPVLLRLLRARDGWPKGWLTDLAESQGWLKLHLVRADTLHEAALGGFELLGPAGEPAVPKLGPWLRDEETAPEAARALVFIGTDRATAALIRSVPAQPAVGALLGQPGANRLLTPGVMPELCALVSSENQQARATAGRLLLSVAPAASEVAVPLLLAALPDAKADARREIIDLMGKLDGHPDLALPALIQSLDDPDAGVRGRAAYGLSRFAANAGTTVGPLRKLLADPSPEVRWAATNTLEFLVDEQTAGPGLEARMREGLRPGTAVLAAVETRLGDTNAEVRRATAQRLEEYGLGALSASNALAQLLTDADPAVRRAASNALIRISREAALAEKLAPVTREGGVIRGPRDRKAIALVFTGHGYAEGGETILAQLEKHRGKGSFFFTGDFLANPSFNSLVQRIVQAGHYLGPHSDKHVLYCPWEGPKKTLISREDFRADLERNLQKIEKFGLEREQITHFLPPYEYYNEEIAAWAKAMGLTLVNFTPGTRSNADYTGEAEPNFASSQTIFDSILAREQQDPNGLNGFLLLLHIGSGPGRADKFHERFGELLDYLAGRGYQFVRVDDLVGHGHAGASGN